MRKHGRNAASWLLIIVVFFAIRAWQSRDLPDGPAPPLLGYNLAGEQVSLSDYRGAPVLVHFWATWCPVCEFENASVASVAKDWPVLTIAMNSGNAMEVAHWLEEEGLDFPQVLVDQNGHLARAWGVHGVPVSLVVDDEGELVAREVGFTTEWGIRLRLWWANLG